MMYGVTKGLTSIVNMNALFGTGFGSRFDDSSNRILDICVSYFDEYPSEDDEDRSLKQCISNQRTINRLQFNCLTTVFCYFERNELIKMLGASKSCDEF